MERECDLAIVGGGLAGLTAALFAGRHGLAPLLVMDYFIGGQILNIPHVVDYPGFPDGIAGHELGPLVQRQAEAAGAEIVMEEAVAIGTGDPRHRIETAAGTILRPRAVILALGSSFRRLGVPGEAEFVGRGVSSCASCDGPLFSDKRVAVVGGGDSALLEAGTLAGYGAQVLLVHRGQELDGQQMLQDALASQPNVTIALGTELVEVVGDQTVTGVVVREVTTEQTRREAAAGVFIYAGLVPRSELLRGVVRLDGGGHVEVNARLETDAPGIFAAGDVRQHSSGQLVSAAGDGAAAAVAAWQYLTRKN